VLDERLERVAAKLAAARSSPVARAAFGADTHGYVPGEPLPDAAVAEFEERHGTVLPASYRLFLTELGNGGAGPGYGLTPLPTTCCAHRRTGHLAAPSPYRPGPRYRDDWEVEFEEPWGDGRTFMPGTVTVADHGCSLVTRLVVTGPTRGRLINLDHDGPVGPYVVEDTDFLAWYERWLDEAMAGYDVGFFGERLPLDEPELLAVLAEDPSPDRRGRAAASLLDQPAVSEQAWDALHHAMTADADASVRAGVWHRLRWPRDGDPQRPLSDAETVADGIARHARTASPRDLTALNVLRRLTPDDILAELAGDRRRAAYRLSAPWGIDLDDRHDPRLDDAVGRLLRDPDPIVRCHAVAAVRSLALAHRHGEVRDMDATETDPWVRTWIRVCLHEPPTAIDTGSYDDDPRF
jgi:hypothetical protein